MNTTRDDFHFSEVELGRPSKYFALAFSSIGIFLTTPLLYGIIWYERNNHHRTLINQNLSSGMCFAMSWNFLVQIPTFVRYIYGPIGEPFCALDMAFRNFLLMQGLLYIDATIIIRYIFIFCMKNPTALQDDFWRLYLSIWTTVYSTISQIIFAWTPGKCPHNYFICIGKFPLEYVGVPIKKNFSMTLLLLFSLFILLIVGPRIKLYRKQEEKKDRIHSKAVIGSSKRIDTNSLYSLTALALSLVTLFVSATVPPILNAMDPQTIEKYPNYLWVYVLHHYSPQCVLATIGLSFYFKSKPLRTQVLREIAENFTILQQFFEKVNVSPAMNANNNNLTNLRFIKAEEDSEQFKDLVEAHNFI